MKHEPGKLLKAHQRHSRRFEDFGLIYPVLSRRSRGISIGINLSPHKGCNFDCPYCQVDRTGGLNKQKTCSPEQAESELRQMMDIVLSGQLYEHKPFDTTPPNLRRLNDIALSGDGEPTSEKEFLDICQLAAQIRSDYKLSDLKLVLITNATMFHQERVQEALAVLDENNGQIWAKLDAGTESLYQLINKTTIPFQRVLDNIAMVSRKRPIVIQSMFVRTNAQPVTKKEIDAYADRLNEILQTGGQITTIQIYTIARKPTDTNLTPLTQNELETIAQQVKEKVSVPLEIFTGGDDWSNTQ